MSRALPVQGGRRPSRAEGAVIAFLVTFLLIFPKGGFKVGAVPVTWGYLGLALFAVSLPVAALSRREWRVSRQRLLVLALLLPFQLVVWTVLLTRGFEGLGFAISLLVSFFFVPVVMVLVAGPHLDRLDPGLLFRLIRFGVLAVSVYGIFLFFYKLATGSFLEIPYLTVNAGDVGELEDKFIDRGGVFKLISTYNNGNIYGVCILMLLPLYAWLGAGAGKQAVVKVSLLLTLSRTVWAGLLFYELLQRFWLRRVTARTLLLLGLSMLLIAGGVWYALDLMNLGTEFLLDRNLGGRIGQWREVESAAFLPHRSFDTIVEIVYLSVLDNFGMIGLAAFVIGMAGPVALFALRAVPDAGRALKRTVAAGLAIYLFVSLSDGAILYIPVMAIYWFLVSLLLAERAAAPA